MDKEDIGKIKVVKGKELIILDVDGYGGYVSIEKEKMTMKMEEIFPEESLVNASNDTGLPIQAIRNMTFIAWIKSDLAGDNRAGWKKHEKILKDLGLINR